MDNSLAGKLLVSLPAIEDPRFRRSVILLCAHNEEHAMGIVLNQIMDDITLPDLLEQMNVEGAPKKVRPILLGGPVCQERGFVLHSEDFDCEGATLAVTSGVCLTATAEILHAMASDDPPENAVLALGYAGWGAGQLEEELAQNVWLVAEPSPEIVFDQSYSTKWSRALETIGVSADRLQVEGGRA